MKYENVYLVLISTDSSLRASAKLGRNLPRPRCIVIWLMEVHKPAYIPVKTCPLKQMFYYLDVLVCLSLSAQCLNPTLVKSLFWVEVIMLLCHYVLNVKSRLWVRDSCFFEILLKVWLKLLLKPNTFWKCSQEIVTEFLDT